MRKLYTGKLYGLAATTKKKLTEKQVLEVLNQAEAEFPTLKMAAREARKKFGISDTLSVSNDIASFMFETLVMEWKKKWLSYES